MEGDSPLSAPSQRCLKTVSGGDHEQVNTTVGAGWRCSHRGLGVHERWRCIDGPISGGPDERGDRRRVCPASPEASASAAAFDPSTVDPKSLLGVILSSGKIRISTDPNYKPFSFLNTATNTYEGFDTSTAEETVKRLSAKLGKEITIDWQTPGWDMITAGSWGGRWDISIGSMSVTVGRAKVVDFADPYYFDSGAVAVPKDSPVQSLSELDGGKTFCVGTATTYEQWLKGTLEIVDPNIVTAPTTPDVTALPTDNECIQAVDAGRKFDAIVANAQRPGRRGQERSRSACSAARRSSPCRSRSRSTRAVPTTRRCSPCSTRSSLRCTRTARSRAVREVAREGRHHQAVLTDPEVVPNARPDASSSGRASVSRDRGGRVR